MARPRTASLRVQHQRGCPHYTLSSLDSIGKCNGKLRNNDPCPCNGKGCRCKPRYFTFHRVRGADGKLRARRGQTVQNKTVALKALRQLQVEIDQGRAGVADVEPDETTFAEWAADFLHRHRGGNGKRPRKESTIRAYEATIGYAEAAFGGHLLGEIGDAELDAFAATIRQVKGGGSDATLAKHLRQLGAIFQYAADRGKITANPVPRFRKALDLRVPRGDEAYTDAELEALWATMAQLKYKTVYVMLCKAAVATGARAGELIALDWRDLDLTSRKLRLRHTYTARDGLTLPKDNEPRTLHLTGAAVRVFEEWIAVCGVQPDDAPIFQAPHGGRIARDYLGRLVDQARVKAGIPAVGESGQRRKPLHAFRACFARVCREAGLDPQWVMAQLGHSTADLTLNVYGKWSEAGLAAEAAKAGEETFPV